MLNKGLRDQESMRIDNVLKTLLSLFFVPKFWNLEDTALVENELKDLGMNIQSLLDFTEKDLITHLLRCHLDWNQLEQFADFLVVSSKENPFDFSELINVFRFCKGWICKAMVRAENNSIRFVS